MWQRVENEWDSVGMYMRYVRKGIETGCMEMRGEEGSEKAAGIEIKLMIDGVGLEFGDSFGKLRIVWLVASQ